MITLKLDIPPSTNNLYVNVPGRGRVKSKAYKAWLAQPAVTKRRWDLYALPFASAELRVQVPNNRRRDLDNMLKAVGDFVQSLGIVKDDRHIDRIVIERSDKVKDCVMVYIFDLSIQRAA